MRISFDGFCTLFGYKRKFYGQGSPAARFRMNFALAAQMGNTLLDAEQPKTLGLLDVESFSIVTDGKYETLWFLLDLDAHSRRIRVGGAIM